MLDASAQATRSITLTDRGVCIFIVGLTVVGGLSLIETGCGKWLCHISHVPES